MTEDDLLDELFMHVPHRPGPFPRRSHEEQCAVARRAAETRRANSAARLDEILRRWDERKAGSSA